jgi:hypothetical protein
MTYQVAIATDEDACLTFITAVIEETDPGISRTCSDPSRPDSRQRKTQWRTR